MSTDTTWFASKVDWWLGIILAVAPLVSLVGLLDPAAYVSWHAVVPVALGPVFFAAIYGLLVFPMRYGVGREELTIRHGVVRWRVPLAAIISVEPTHNPLSSPALSLDRLRVTTGSRLRDSVMISPADRERFLALLTERAGLTREGDRLVRR